MQGFTQREKRMPDIRAAKKRAKDFEEIYEPFKPTIAVEQAERCAQCGIPFCQSGCPLSNNIPDWLRLTAEGQLREAYAMSSATNNFPEVCGSICPQDRLCEQKCVINHGFESVTIGAVEKYITETAWNEGWVEPFTPKEENGLSVGIIGAGPAGLAAAEQLRRKGYEVHVYDRYDRVGGLLIYGIPNFKLDKESVQRRTAQFEKSGVVFHTGIDIGTNTDFADLQAKHDAMLIATGVYKARELGHMNAGLENILPAMTYLTASNRLGLGDTVPELISGYLNAKDKHVVVIGGGDTAMDCVRTAVRQQAKEVTCLYRRDRENMPGSMREVKNAEDEGVKFQWLSAPKAFIGDSKVEQLIVQPMRLGAVDASGRRSPEPIKGEEYRMKADMVITALGFTGEELPTLFNQPDLTMTSWGTVHADKQGMTKISGVFAAGDIVRGASLVVWAIKDGRDIAEAMHGYMQAQQQKKQAA